MKLTVAILIVALATGATIVTRVTADSWALPKQAKYYAPNKEFYVEVTPKKLESQLKYFEDKVANKDNAGGKAGEKEKHAKAAFYARRPDGSYAKRKEFPLVNEVAPVDAVVSGKGDYFVTFDNWHEAGYGDDVIVIYRADGSLIKKFGLEDVLTKGDIEMLPHSVSSIWWGANHYIDEAKAELVLKIVANRRSPREEGAQFHELKIELASGRLLEPVRDLFPQPRVSVSAGIDTEVIPKDQNISPAETKCSSTEGSFESPDFRRIPAKQLYENVRAQPFPPYPVIAKSAGAQGVVIVEVLVAKSGEVICARPLSGHLLLRGAAVAAVLHWKFDPIVIDGSPAKVTSTVSLTFKRD